MKLALGIRRWTATIAIGAGLMVLARPAHATFPGKNGGVAFRVFGLDNANAIHLGTQKLTNPTDNQYDFYPSVSPDGSKVAFLRQFLVTGSGYIYILMTVNADGTNIQGLTDTEGLVGANNFGGVSYTAWATDGRISFITYNTGTTNGGIYTRDPSGGLVKTVDEPFSSGLSWSPIDKELVYGCSVRTDDNGSPRQDLCIWDDAKKQRRVLQIDVPNAIPNRGGAASPKWTADGERIVFSYRYQTSEGHDVSREDIFSVNADGSGLQQLTDSGPDLCASLPQPSGGVSTYSFEFPSPSPDGGSFVADRLAMNGISGSTCDTSGHGQELYVAPLGGGAGTVLGGLVGFDQAINSGTDWQPLVTNLIVNVDDGHDHPLKGLKLELQLPSGTVVGNNTTGGTYTFDGVPDGTYTLRATLTDNPPSGGGTPVFDIRHAPEPDTPAWIEKPVKVKVGATLETVLHFEDSSELTATSIQDSTNRERLDDMAVIYWRTRQYVDWVKANLVGNTGETVEYYTFADTDPFPVCEGGTMNRYRCNTDTDCPGATCGFEVVAPTDAYYQSLGSYIVFGTDISDYSARSPAYDSDHHIGKEGPENAEWHEFTHHLYHTYVSNAPCIGDTAHFGYLNEDTCDSMDEGFACFLPTYAAQDILDQKDTHYDDIAPSLEAHVKAWVVHYDDTDPSKNFGREDVAVAALYWDLTDAAPDVENTEIIGQDGLNHLVTYIDTEQLTLQDLWTVLINSHPTSVRALRQVLGTVLPSSDTDISVDLDADGVADVAPLDEVFLMHGFYPVDAQQLANSTKWRYDVGAAQKKDSTVARDAAVGSSDHYIQGQGGTIDDTFIPRSNSPVAAGANLAFTVQDASGRTLSGASVDVAVSYPGMPTETKAVTLGAANGALVHLELPPYFDYLPPAGAPLPACDPTTDVQVNVTLRTTVNGYVSNDVTSFDNCTYLQAVAGAAGGAAMTVTSIFPDDSTPPVSTILTAPTDTLIGGATVGVWIVRFTCDDPADTGFAAGCDHTEYMLDGGPLATYRERVILGGIGAHTLQYRSVDAAGNQEEFQSVELDVAPIPAPTITGFSPTTGVFGTEVTITGTNLDRTTAVSFNGVPATFSPGSSWATELRAVVPVGATTGPITVTTTGGTATTSTNMTIIQPPTITGFSPTSGVVGSLLTVTGTNFDTTNNAYIGGNNAGWRVDSSTQVTLLVLSGDTTGPIQIQTQAGTATSATNFVVLTATTTTTSSTTTTTKGHKTTTTTQTTTSTTPGSTSTTTTTMKGHKTTTTTTIGTTTTTVPNGCRASGAACSHSSDCCSGTCTGKTKTCS